MDKCTFGYQSQMNPPCLSSIDVLTTNTPNQFIWTNAHLDTRVRWTPHLSSIDALTTSTPNQFIWTNAHWDTRVKWPPISNCNKGCTWYTALYMLSLDISCHLELSNWTGQSCIYFYRTYLSIYLWLYYVVVVAVVVVVVYYTTTTICCCCCCCCVLHNNNKDNYKIHINWLWSLC